jgi:hypothetical protein
MVGLEAPVRPQRGQIVVTERLKPFLHHPIVTMRQTDEGSVMIGDSQGGGGIRRPVGTGVVSTIAERATRMFPLLGRANVVRSWAALRVMTRDGFPIYDQSTSHPGAFLTTCHSGVTLAAAHALHLAPMLVAGALAPERRRSAPGDSMFRRLPEAGATALTIEVDGTRIAGARRRQRRGGAARRRPRHLPRDAGDRCPARALLHDGRVLRVPVTIDGIGNRQACLVRVADGMRVETQAGARELGR